jgi:hypothetical protein
MQAMLPHAVRFSAGSDSQTKGFREAGGFIPLRMLSWSYGFNVEVRPGTVNALRI